MLLSLLAGYQLYLTYEECKRAMNLEISYVEAERIMSVIEEYIPIHLSPELVVKSEDQRANELLDARTAFEDFLQKRFHEDFRPIVMGFFHQLRHGMKMDHVWASSLQISLTAFHNYAIGMIDREELRKTMIRVDVQRIRTVVVDSMYIRHDAMQVENIFREVCAKRVARDLKKEGRVLTEINIEIGMPDEWKQPE